MASRRPNALSKKANRTAAPPPILSDTSLFTSTSSAPDPVHGVRGGYCDDMFNGKLLSGTSYRLGQRIGSGTFGEIRITRDIKTNRHLAAKLEPDSVIPSQLTKEWVFYGALNKTPAIGIPRALHFGPCGTYKAMVLELLGPSLEQIFKLCERKFSLHTILMIAIQLITRLEYLHSCSIINRDIKPENFLISKPPNQDTTIFITDFGLSKFFTNPGTGSHIIFKEHQSFVGTPRYASLNALMRSELSRRDDLESLGYCLIYFLRGSLPWSRQKFSNSSDACKEILELKKNTHLDVLCNGEQEFIEYMQYVRNLAFEQTPDYDFLRSLFKRRIQKEVYDPEGKMDWTSKVPDRVRMRQLQRMSI